MCLFCQNVRDTTIWDMCLECLVMTVGIWTNLLF